MLHPNVKVNNHLRQEHAYESNGTKVILHYSRLSNISKKVKTKVKYKELSSSKEFFLTHLSSFKYIYKLKLNHINIRRTFTI